MTNAHGAHLIDQLGILLDGMETCTDDKQFRSALSSFTRAIGLRRFAFVCTGGDYLKTVTDLPSVWEERYHAKRYSVIDPVVGSAKRSSRPFQWSLPAFANSSLARKAFCEEISEVGVVSGVTIPVQAGFGRTAMLSFMTDNQTVPNFCMVAMQNAVAAVAYAHRHVSQKPPPSVSPEDALTSRETVCVVWTSFGKKKAEIAQMYGLSEKTVRFHLDNAKIKLNASNVAHLVRRAFETGMIPSR